LLLNVVNSPHFRKKSRPAINIDFPHDQKDDVVDIIFVKYGREHCAVVGGYSTFHPPANSDD